MQAKTGLDGHTLYKRSNQSGFLPLNRGSKSVNTSWIFSDLQAETLAKEYHGQGAMQTYL